jgi:hypothetical protein
MFNNEFGRTIMEERRQALRRRTSLRGKMEFLTKSTFECVIRDLSDSGARVRCDQQIALPDFFDLVIEKKNEKRPASAVWRSENEIGLAFEDVDDFGNVLAFRPRRTPR